MIYTFGETILDIIFKERQPVAARPGGAMLNTAVSLGRCNLPVSLISEISNDLAGRWITTFLQDNGISVNHLVTYDHGKTPISIASLDKRGEASYDFYKNYPAERLEEVKIEFRGGDLLLFGSFYSIQPEIRRQVRGVLEEAEKRGVFILYDPNIRKNHARTVRELVPVVKENIMFSRVIRASKDDLMHIFGPDYAEVADEYVAMHDKVFIITDGAGEIRLQCRDFRLTSNPHPVDVISSIGAGDTFNAGIIYGLQHAGARQPFSSADISRDAWHSIIETASKFAGDCCSSLDNYISESFGEKIRIS